MKPPSWAGAWLAQKCPGVQGHTRGEPTASGLRERELIEPQETFLLVAQLGVGNLSSSLDLGGSWQEPGGCSHGEWESPRVLCCQGRDGLSFSL